MLNICGVTCGVTSEERTKYSSITKWTVNCGCHVHHEVDYKPNAFVQLDNEQRAILALTNHIHPTVKLAEKDNITLFGGRVFVGQFTVGI